MVDTSLNSLQSVATYQPAGLALIQNSNCFISNANKKFQNFQNLEGNLGTSVTFDLQPRFITNNSLVASFQGAEQRVQTLTVDQAESVAYAFSAQQFIYNVEDYMEKFGKGAIAELGAKIESNVALNCKSAPYRFYGDGVTPINSFQQLASALAFFRNFGAIRENTRGYLSDLAIPNIVNSGLGQFAMKRNDEMAMSWELGNFSMCDWYQSNLLPVHTAGTEGVQGSTLTVVSVTKNADGGVTSIVFSGTNGASDADSVKENDKFQFSDGVSGQPNMRFLTFVGHQVSQCPVQFRATADAASTGASQVTVLCDPPLQAAAGKNQNINNEIVAGMQCTVLPSHRAGVIMSGDPLFLAMPRLPMEDPFPTANMADPDTGASIRQYYGSKFGENARGMVHDAIWGSTLVAENSMSLIFPL